MQCGSGNVKKLKRPLTSIVFAVFLALKLANSMSNARAYVAPNLSELIATSSIYCLACTVKAKSTFLARWQCLTKSSN